MELLNTGSPIFLSAHELTSNGKKLNRPDIILTNICQAPEWPEDLVMGIDSALVFLIHWLHL